MGGITVLPHRPHCRVRLSYFLPLGATSEADGYLGPRNSREPRNDRPSELSESGSIQRDDRRMRITSVGVDLGKRRLPAKNVHPWCQSRAVAGEARHPEVSGAGRLNGSASTARQSDRRNR
jgi:hypothetical protein